MRTIIVDVRTNKEFRDGSIAGAINIPANDFKMVDYAPFKNQHICLVCASGRRADNIRDFLKRNGFMNVSILDRQLNDLLESNPTRTTWSIDRQFRLTLGILLAIFCGVYFLGIATLWILPVVISAGLLYSAITDNCYLKIGIAKLPWNNTQKKTKRDPLSQISSLNQINSTLT